MKTYNITNIITPKAPFDFDQSIRFIGGFTPAMGEQSISDQSVTKAISTEHQHPVLFTLRSTGTIDAPELDCTLIQLKPASIWSITRTAALDRIRFYLSLDDDLAPFYAIGEQDEQFAPIIERLYGYHQVKFTTPFENAVWAILAQRTTMAIARKVKQELTEFWGNLIEYEGTRYYTFPSPQDFYKHDIDLYETLQEIVSAAGYARKTDFLMSAIRAFDDVDEMWLREGDYDEVFAWLKGIDGIGDWSASFIMVRGLGRVERLPLNEAKVVSAFKKVYGAGADMKRIGARYGEYQGYWTHYLRVGT